MQRRQDSHAGSLVPAQGANRNLHQSVCIKRLKPWPSKFPSKAHSEAPKTGFRTFEVQVKLRYGFIILKSYLKFQDSDSRAGNRTTGHVSRQPARQPSEPPSLGNPSQAGVLAGGELRPSAGEFFQENRAGPSIQCGQRWEQGDRGEGRHEGDWRSLHSERQRGTQPSLEPFYEVSHFSGFRWLPDSALAINLSRGKSSPLPYLL